MRQFVIGTAGHIDHGKSSLVKALTGIDPDRLEEEKRRGMTIDLGFAHLDLPGGRRVGIVDVPGHERLIKNMLAGATGIDLVLLVVAADEGVMPQTREHLDILRFLQVRRGVIALNKIDLVEDQEWLGLVREDVAALAAGTFLEGAPIIPVSARTGAGLEVLVQAMNAMLNDIPAREADAPARLPIDRAFTMAGFGTVVTGTLWSGRVSVGDVLELLPEGGTVRVRQVQSHGQVVEEGVAGSRVALNLVGLSKEEIERGDVLVTPGIFEPTDILDVRVRLLPGTPPLAHMTRLRVYMGTAEAFGRLALLDRERLAPGETALAQLRLEMPIVAARGDPFVLRRYSPLLTVGGGEVIQPQAPRRRRRDAAALAEVASLEHSDIDALVAGAVAQAGAAGTTVDDLARRLAATRAQVEERLRGLMERDEVLLLRGRAFHARARAHVEEAIRRTLADYHTQHPWRRGMPREELKARAFPGGDDRLYMLVFEELERTGVLAAEGAFVWQAEHAPALTPQEAELRTRLSAWMLEARFGLPSREEALAATGGDRDAAERMFQALADEGLLVEAARDQFVHRQVREEVQGVVAGRIRQHGEITVATLRDLLGPSRKFALAILEYLDTVKFTRRVGDRRVLVQQDARTPST